MKKLFKAGRIFYGVAIAEIGIQTIYYHNFPYIVPLPKDAGDDQCLDNTRHHFRSSIYPWQVEYALFLKKKSGRFLSCLEACFC